MDMGRNKSWDNNASSQAVLRLMRVFLEKEVCLVDSCNYTIVDIDSSICNYAPSGINRDDCCMDIQHFHSRGLKKGLYNYKHGVLRTEMGSISNNKAYN